VGYTPYGDHSAQICGLEVVLPTGEIVRTGMGAMTGSPTWQLYRNGYGPGWDQMFAQSNFGVVTKLGLWLMPEPESVLGIDFEFDKPEDLGWAIDTIMPLRREGIIRQSPSMGNWLRSAAVMTTRNQWAEHGRPLGEDAITAIRKGFNGKPVLAMKPVRWVRGDAPEGSPFSGVPLSFPLANANWYGGRGGHTGYSPVLPPRGNLAMDQF